jgi:VanZ family protein
LIDTYRSRLVLWGPVVLQMAVIFIVSSISNIGPLPAGLSDKSGHSIGYAILAALLLRALADRRPSAMTWSRCLLAVVLAASYGVTDEIHQAFVPGRTPDVMDVAADALGAALAAATLGTAAWIARRSP